MAERRPVSRWLLAAVVVATILLAGAAVLANHAASERDAATAQRSRAEAHLAQQRDDTAAAATVLAAQRKMAMAFVQAMQAPLGTAAELGQLNDQGAEGEADVLHAGEADNTSSYNAAVDKANALTDRYNALLSQLDDQMRGIR